MKMPFGKYKGEEIEDLETSYITWCLENLNLSAQLESEMEAQLVLRRGQGIIRNSGNLG